MHLSRHPTSYPTRWQEIAAKLEVELRTHYRCGDYLPAEQQLADRYEVNRHTLRRAIDQLVERGWVQRRQGVGVLVLMRPFDYPLNAQARFSQNLLDQGSHPTSEKLLSVLRPASSHVADALGIQEGDNVIHLRTLRRVNGVAVCQIDHYFADLALWPVLQISPAARCMTFCGCDRHCAEAHPDAHQRPPRAGEREQGAGNPQYGPAALRAHPQPP
jgi:GntR family phosphonate transport system transcriptional regulator